MTARRPVPGQSPLTSAEVYRIVAARAATTPVPTTSITDMCQAAYPTHDNVNNYRVLAKLRYLGRRGRVVALHGQHDADKLADLGVKVPHKQWLYWKLPASAQVYGTRLIHDGETHFDEDLEQAVDGREPFPVSDPNLNAPWGAVLELTDTGHPGWWQRQDSEWIPVHPPANAGA